MFNLQQAFIPFDTLVRIFTRVKRYIIFRESVCFVYTYKNRYKQHNKCIEIEAVTSSCVVNDHLQHDHWDLIYIKFPELTWYIINLTILFGWLEIFKCRIEISTLLLDTLPSDSFMQLIEQNCAILYPKIPKYSCEFWTISDLFWSFLNFRTSFST